ncbi:hypothetical protein [Streptomyces chrestomyceticus]|uniref:hypothetical protein n=1 Tax=Streptomyces chrestomyceticus TaxID=68185 RepID=UPI001F496187|nr:hypothetical protein [Streptomyces chrestomyceticus]
MPVSSQGVTVVALLAAPDAPTEIAQRMARTLPGRLADRSGQGRRFDVEVVSEPFTSGTEDPSTSIRRIKDRGSTEKWDVVVALTDLPLHSHGRKLAVDLHHKHGLALLSLPSLGGLRLQKRVRRAVEEALLGLAGPDTTGAIEPLPLRGSFVHRLAPVEPGRSGEEESGDVRYVVSGPRGYLRVLAGMVRANQPWRLVPGLSKALAAALATGAVATVNSTVWSLAAALSTPRLVTATVGSVAIMIGRLIVDANLWHRAPESSPEARKRAALYNASTVVTLGIGPWAAPSDRAWRATRRSGQPHTPSANRNTAERCTTTTVTRPVFAGLQAADRVDHLTVIRTQPPGPPLTAPGTTPAR